MRKLLVIAIAVCAIVFYLVSCNEPNPVTPTVVKEDFNGYETKEKWGEHIVTVAGCQDCHSPKKMTPMGPVIDSSVMLAGHLAGSPEPVVNKKEIQSKGLAVTMDLTAWVGPWGTSYAANLTSDATGIGNWKEEQFITALRKGKAKGLETERTLLPPMPWNMYQHFSDDEIKAIFAFLKSTKSVKNSVPAPLPPVQ